MFSGHFHIPGHSGTDQKHRKAFAMLKEHNKTRKVTRNIDPTKENNPSDRKKYGVNNKHKRIQQSIILSLIIMLIIAIGIVIPKYSSLSYELPTAEYDTPEIEEPKSIRLYHLLLASGNIDLEKNKLNKAQAKFTEAIELYPTEKAAQIELAKVLTKQCEQKNLYCSEAKKQLAYLKEMK